MIVINLILLSLEDCGLFDITSKLKDIYTKRENQERHKIKLEKFN